MMTESQINKELQDALALSGSLEKTGHPDVARQVLALASTMAISRMMLAGITSHPVLCSTCGRKQRTRDSIEFTNAIGECPMCDHLRGETYE